VPALSPAAPRKVKVLVVEEQALVEQTNLLQIGRSEQHCRPAPPEYLSWGIKLTQINLEISSIRSVPTLEKPIARVVDHVEGLGSKSGRVPYRVRPDQHGDGVISTP
jgi:hypothetical protein